MDEFEWTNDSYPGDDDISDEGFIPEPPKDEYEWSKHQLLMFDDMGSGVGNTVIIARAGSAKTTSLVEGFKFIPKKSKTLMVAFNKAIADELKVKSAAKGIFGNVEISTLHSLGLRVIKKAVGKNITVDNNKCFSIVTGLIGDKHNYDLRAQFVKCVSLCKGFIVDSPDGIYDLMEKFDIDPPGMEKELFASNVIKILDKCKKMKTVVDFDDMIWFPFVHDMPVGNYDMVLIDEAQDLNKLQIHLALSAAGKKGRIIAVGDDFQCIYSWRGADENAIKSIIEKTSAKTLSLPISYRCPRKVIDMAKEIVPDIESYEHAKDGIVEWINEEKLLSSVAPGDFILSRTNAPLVKYCMMLLKSGVPANIQGRDIGVNLLNFVKKSKAKAIDKFLDYVKSWKQKEVMNLMKLHKDTAAAEDKAECLIALCEGISSIDKLKENIKNMFDDVDDSKRVVLSTVHKAKGLERERVFMLSWTFRKTAEITEESRIFYVALTRTKSELYLVKKDKKAKAKNKKFDFSDEIPED